MKILNISICIQRSNVKLEMCANAHTPVVAVASPHRPHLAHRRSPLPPTEQHGPSIRQPVRPSVSRSVRRSVRHSSETEPRQNGRTDPDPAPAEDPDGPREPCTRWSPRSHTGGNSFEGKEKERPITNYRDTPRSSARKRQNRPRRRPGCGPGRGPRNPESHEDPDPHGKGQL